MSDTKGYRMRKTGTTRAEDRTFVEALLARGTAEPTAERTVRVWIGKEGNPGKRLMHLTPEEMRWLDEWASR